MCFVVRQPVCVMVTSICSLRVLPVLFANVIRCLLLHFHSTLLAIVLCVLNMDQQRNTRLARGITLPWKGISVNPERHMRNVFILYTADGARATFCEYLPGSE